MSTVIEAKNLNLWYGAHHALLDVNIEIPEHEITALIVRFLSTRSPPSSAPPAAVSPLS